jgi:hypothetical protein
MNKRIMSMSMKACYGVLIMLLAGAVGVAQASPPMAASGNFTQTEITSLEVRVAGPNTIIELTSEGLVGGNLSGSYKDSLKVVIHPNGLFTAHNRITCECTVEGKEGVLELVVVDTGEPVSPTTAIFKGTAVIKGATGELSGLRGVFQVEGTVDLLTGLSTYTLSGQIHFDP